MRTTFALTIDDGPCRSGAGNSMVKDVVSLLDWNNEVSRQQLSRTQCKGLVVFFDPIHDSSHLIFYWLGFKVPLYSTCVQDQMVWHKQYTFPRVAQG